MPFRTPVSRIRQYSDEALETSLQECERVIRQQRADLELYELCRALRLEARRREYDKALYSNRHPANTARVA